MAKLTRQMFIGELARQAGLSAKAIRFYEEAGLLPRPPRTEGGYRLYTEDDLQQLRFIQTAKALGLRLAEIKGILERRRQQGLPCDYVGRVIQERIAQLDEEIAALIDVRQRLQAVLAQWEAMCGQSTTAPASIICPCIELASAASPGKTVS